MAESPSPSPPETLLIEHPDGTTTRVGEPAPPKRVAASRYTPGKLGDGELPTRVNLAAKLTPVEDQGKTLSCVANAAAGAYEYLVKRHLGLDFDVSRLFIYYNARKQNGEQNADGGTLIESAIAGLLTHGACSERAWPFDLERINEEPPPSAYDEGKQFRAEYTEQVATELLSWRHCLAEGHPILFMLRVYRSFYECRSGRITPPLESEIESGKRINHAMLCVGYHDDERLFIVRNSWGPKWGLHGYGFVPYDYLLDPKYNVDDSWIIRRITDIHEIDRSTWGDELPTLPSLGSELLAMKDGDYAALLSALGEVPLLSRLAHLYLEAASADQLLDDKEQTALLDELQRATQQLGDVGMAYEPAAVLHAARRFLGNRALLDESIAIIGSHLSPQLRAGLLRSVRRIAGADAISSPERQFLEQLIDRWHIEDLGDEPSLDSPPPEAPPLA